MMEQAPKKKYLGVPGNGRGASAIPMRGRRMSAPDVKQTDGQRQQRSPDH
jgi:hypothetical protein